MAEIDALAVKQSTTEPATRSKGPSYYPIGSEVLFSCFACLLAIQLYLLTWSAL